MISNATVHCTAKKSGGREPVTRNQAKTGKLAAPTIDEIDTMRVRATITAKTPMSSQCGPRSAGEKDSKTGGDAFAAAKAQPAGEDMAQHGKERGDGLRGAQRDGGHEKGAEETAQPDRRAALQHVEEKGGRAKALASGPHDIGGSDVTAAYRANVLAAEDADEQISRRD